jgi:hypothetical protein
VVQCFYSVAVWGTKNVYYFNLFVTVILKSCQYDVIGLVKGEDKGKIHFETGDEGPERE